MATVTTPSRLEYVTEYNLYFGDTASGYSFPCDEKGNVNVEALCIEAVENLERCLSTDLAKTKQVQTTEFTVYHPAVLLCDCGESFELADVWLETCPRCHADYNGNGQRLAPRSQWDYDVTNDNY